MLSAGFLRLSVSSVMVISTKKATYERVLRKSLVTCYTGLTCVISAAEWHLFLAALLTDLNKDDGLSGPLERPFWTMRNSPQLQLFANSCHVKSWH